MPSRESPHRISAEADRLRLDEAGILGVLKDYAALFGGFTRHVRSAQGQDLEGVGDVLMWLPTPFDTVLLGLIEVKVGDDRVSPAQRLVHEANLKIDRVVAAILREGASPREGERSLSQVLDRLEDARTAE